MHFFTPKSDFCLTRIEFLSPIESDVSALECLLYMYRAYADCLAVRIVRLSVDILLSGTPVSITTCVWLTWMSPRRYRDWWPKRSHRRFIIFVVVNSYVLGSRISLSMFVVSNCSSHPLTPSGIFRYDMGLAPIHSCTVCLLHVPKSTWAQKRTVIAHLWINLYTFVSKFSWNTSWLKNSAFRVWSR